MEFLKAFKTRASTSTFKIDLIAIVWLELPMLELSKHLDQFWCVHKQITLEAMKTLKYMLQPSSKADENTNYLLGSFNAT